MDDPKWLRLVVIGLVLAAIAVGYFLFTGKFLSSTTQKVKSGISQAIPNPSPAQSPSPSATANPSVSPSPTPGAAFQKIAERTTKAGQPIQNLPRTGFPAGLIGALAVSTMIAGWGLRRFPH